MALNSKRDPFANYVDIVVYAEFDSYANLDAYQAHPDYKKVTQVVRPLRHMRIAADYETG